MKDPQYKVPPLVSESPIRSLRSGDSTFMHGCTCLLQKLQAGLRVCSGLWVEGV